MIMNFENFVDELSEVLKQEFANEQIIVQRNMVQKINGDVEQMVVKYPEQAIAPSFYLKDQYEKLYEGYSVNEIARDMARFVRAQEKHMPELPEFNQKTARENLYATVINAEINKELLKNVPHEKFQDLAVISRFRVGKDGSIMVTNEFCKHLQLTPEEILEIARRNMEKEKYVCISMHEKIKNEMISMGAQEDFVEELFETRSVQFPLYVFTNSQNYDGAVAVISQSVMDEGFQKVKVDYPDISSVYVIPSSRHEIILVPDCVVDDVKHLKEIHDQVQEDEVREVDRLTDQVYRYDGLSRKLSIVYADEKSKEKEQTKQQIKTYHRAM